MNRLKAAFFLVIAAPFIAPAVALTWFRAHGNIITMHPFLEAWVWFALIGSLGTIVSMTVVLLRGR